MIARHKSFAGAVTVFLGLFILTASLARLSYRVKDPSLTLSDNQGSRTVANDSNPARPFRVFLVDQRRVTGATRSDLQKISNREVESVELIFYPTGQMVNGLYFQAIHHKVSASGNQDYVIGTKRTDQPSNLPPEFLAPGREVLAMAQFDAIDRFTGDSIANGGRVWGVDYENYRWGVGQLQLNYDCLWGDKVWVRNATAASTTAIAAFYTYKLAKYLSRGIRPGARGAEEANLMRQVAARVVNFVHHTWGVMEFFVAAPIVYGVAQSVYLATTHAMDRFFFGSEHERVQRVRKLLNDAQASGGDPLRFARISLPYDNERMNDVFNHALQDAETVRRQGAAAQDTPQVIGRNATQAFQDSMDRQIAQNQSELEAQFRRRAPAFVRIPSDDLNMDIQALHRFVTFYAARDLASTHSGLVGNPATGISRCRGYSEIRHTLEEGLNDFRRAMRDGAEIISE